MRSLVFIRCFLLCQFVTLSLQEGAGNDEYLKGFGDKITEQELEICKTINFLHIGKVSITPTDMTLRLRAAFECCRYHGLELLSDPSILNSKPSDTKKPVIEKSNVTGACLNYKGFESGPPLNKSDGCHLEKLPFICEAPHIRRGELPSPEDKSFCKSVQYQYLGHGYTIQSSPLTTVNQPTAAHCCAVEGGKLVSGKNLEEPIVKLLSEKIGLNGTYWTSGNNLAEDGVFRWGTGHIISSSDPLWGDRKGLQTFIPNRNCLVLIATNGTLNFRQVSCNAKLGILCEADVNPCCKAVDELVFAGSPGEATFHFEPSNTSFEDQMELVSSVSRRLSPSQYTNANWQEIIKVNYLKTVAQESKSGTDVGSGSENKNECPPKRKVWRKYTATCGNITAVYYKGPEFTNSTDTLCKNSRDNKCPDFCVASDEWLLKEELQKYEEDVDWEDRSKSVQQCPLLQFKPAVAKDDYTYVLIENSVKSQLSPSGKTGINYKTYFDNFYAGKTKSGHGFQRNDIPSGHFKNIYQASFSCGKHKAIILEWKMVLFKTGDDVENCKLAKTNGVPLAGCKI